MAHKNDNLNMFFTNKNMQTSMFSVDIEDDEKISLPIMTIFEKACVIKDRVKQLNNGYVSTIEDIIKKENLIKSYDIAMREFSENKLPPYEIKRRRGDGSYETWKHEDFEFYPDQDVFTMINDNSS